MAMDEHQLAPLATVVVAHSAAITATPAASMHLTSHEF